jgi:hypothetical protein
MMTLEERLDVWLKQPGTFVTEAERAFIADMRKAAAAGVGYGWMQQIAEWEWQSKCPNGAWGPELHEAELTQEAKKHMQLYALLYEVLPENMGGTPDLFSPQEGWERWEERAKAALATYRCPLSAGHEGLCGAVKTTAEVPQTSNLRLTDKRAAQMRLIYGDPCDRHYKQEVDAVLAEVQERRAAETPAPLTGVEFLQAWMRTPNPILGDVAPLTLLKSGLGNRLAVFIEQAYEADQSPEETRGK